MVAIGHARRMEVTTARTGVREGRATSPVMQEACGVISFRDVAKDDSREVSRKC